MHSIAEMLVNLNAALADDNSRQAHAKGVAAAGASVANVLPLVHRTCKPGAEETLSTLFRERVIAAGRPCTGSREIAAGIPRAAYFFLGCGAYPEGLVAFVLSREVVLRAPSSFTP